MKQLEPCPVDLALDLVEKNHDNDSGRASRIFRAFRKNGGEFESMNLSIASPAERLAELNGKAMLLNERWLDVFILFLDELIEEQRVCGTAPGGKARRGGQRGEQS